MLVVTAVITTQSYATDQHETFNSVDKTNGLEDPLAITIADRLVLALAGLEQLVRENAELKNALADVKRFQVEADSKIQRLTEEIVQMKEQMREDGTYVRSGLKALASNAAAGQLRRGETKRQSDSTDETGEITRDVAEVKRQLKKVVTDNSQMKISLQFAMGNVSQHLQQLNRTVGELPQLNG